MGASPVSAAAVLIMLPTIALAGYLYARRPVSQARIEAFARNQRLTITAANAEQVVRYLVTTRRWRVAGFVLRWLASRFAGPQPGEISTGAEYITIFVGWFLGALVAEVRVAHLEHGSVRTAPGAARGTDDATIGPA